MSIPDFVGVYGDAVAQIIGGKPCSDNGRPLASHDRHLTDDYARELHADHAASMCPNCGCCWCCDDDCCAEDICRNEDCGCSDKPAPSTITEPRTGDAVNRGERDA